VIGVTVGLAGLVLIAWTIILFWRRGRGTLAPWDPPQKLVVQGPYHRVRNPMITGVATVLAGEALVFGSPALVIYTLTFAAVNALYMPRVEEPRLLARFGDEYADYMREVPRWIPRLGHRPTVGGSLSR
jgi:protein-S-isoprenylcysteine O-methyltransferase Ste14